MARLLRMFLAMALLSPLLAACGGGTRPDVIVIPGDGGVDDPDAPGDGGDGDGDGPGDPGDPPDDGGSADLYARRSADLAQLEAEFLAGTGGTALPGADLPVSGQAVYDGVFAGGISGGGQPREPLNADFSLVADFGLGQVGGRLQNFRKADEVPVLGTLEIRQGSIDRDGAAGFSAVVEGMLTGATGGLDVDATLDGGFHGTGAGWAVGTIDGTVVTSAGERVFAGEVIGR